MPNMSLRSLLFSLAVFVALAAVPCSHGLNQSGSQSSSSAPPSTELQYHGGPLLAEPRSINVYLIWYGLFYQKDRAPITDFFKSFNSSEEPLPHPTVSTWWKTLLSYKDSTGNPVSSTIRVVFQLADIQYSLGKNLKRAQIGNHLKYLIHQRLLPLDSHGVYLFLTTKDVTVERFCMDSCGFHDHILVSKNRRVVYAHVGDPLTQCPGLCAWPYAVPAYGPPGPALVAPNNVGIDGMLINIATVFAGAATNPFRTGYFQGDALAPLEAVTACAGIFGTGAYPGYPGNLMVDVMSKASFNAHGVSGRKFLLPAVWGLLSSSCKVVA